MEPPNPGYAPLSWQKPGPGGPLSLGGYPEIEGLHQQASRSITKRPDWKRWSGWLDLNQRPRAPEARALTKLRHTPIFRHII